MTVKELAAKVEALEAEVAYLRGALEAKSQPIVITQPYPAQPYHPYQRPYITYSGVSSVRGADIVSIKTRNVA